MAPAAVAWRGGGAASAARPLERLRPRPHASAARRERAGKKAEKERSLNLYSTTTRCIM